MFKERYDIETSNDILTFEFVSVGKKGNIIKVIRYTEINVKGYFNLGFGDKDIETGFVSDLTVTNNGDSKKVLATVAATLYAFTDKYPDAVVLATGSTEARTRLYRMGINSNLEIISKDFTILGLTENKWEEFRKNVTYGAFLVKRKI